MACLAGTATLHGGASVCAPCPRTATARLPRPALDGPPPTDAVAEYVGPDLLCVSSGTHGGFCLQYDAGTTPPSVGEALSFQPLTSDRTAAPDPGDMVLPPNSTSVEVRGRDRLAFGPSGDSVRTAWLKVFRPSFGDGTNPLAVARAGDLVRIGDALEFSAAAAWSPPGMFRVSSDTGQVDAYNAHVEVQGQYADSASTCAPHSPQCAPGQRETQPATATQDRECAPCPAGQASPLGVRCAPCPRGTFRDQPGQIECKPRPLGEAAPEEGAQACVVCTGVRQPDVGRVACPLA